MLACRYLDHETLPDENRLYRVCTLAKKTLPVPVLNTCHRFEYYADMTAKQLAVPMKIDGQTLLTITGEEAVLTRLTGIAAGLHSQILGESAIFSQVSAYVESLPVDDPMREVGRTALELARTLRDRHQLEGPSHGLLALQELQSQSGHELLVMVGAGMVGREVVENSRTIGYQQLILVSRDAKRARKRMADCLQPDQVQGLESFLSNPPTVPFDLIIATSDAPEDYRRMIRRLADLQLCRGVIDVSADVIVTGSPNVMTLNDPRMKVLIDRHNAAWLAHIPSLQSELQQLVRQHCHRAYPHSPHRS